jgi:hypothetical protein
MARLIALEGPGSHRLKGHKKRFPNPGVRDASYH